MSEGKIRVPSHRLLRDMPFGSPAVIEASAGTGKTYFIETLVADLIIRGYAKIDEILVVTFTERATAELVARIRKRLESVRAAKESSAAEGEAWMIGPAERARIDRALSHFAEAQISTIHGFAARVMKETAFASGRPLREGRENARARMIDIARAVIRRAARREEIAALIEDYAVEENVAELPDDLLRHLPTADKRRPKTSVPEIRKAGQAFVDLAGSAAERKRLEAHFESRGMTAKQASNAMKKLDQTVHGMRDAIAGDATSPLFAAADDARKSFENYKKHEPGIGAPPLWRALVRYEELTSSRLGLLADELLPEIAAAIASDKHELGWFDFDDMLRSAWEAIADPANLTVTNALRARYRAAVIDEFQDTDRLQWKIFERIFLDRPDVRALYVVGDPKQAIYGFRGADVRTYGAAKEKMLGRNRAPLALRENYRSSPAMIEAVNRVFASGGSDPVLYGDFAYTEPVSAGRPEIGFRTAEPTPPIELWRFTNDDASPLTADELRERFFAAAAGRVRRILAEGTHFHDGKAERAIRLGDVFVLGGSNEETRTIVRIFREHGVPARIAREDGLFESNEVSDVLDILRALARPGDIEARHRAFLTPFFAMSPDEAIRARSLDDRHPYAQRLEDWTALAAEGRFVRLFEALLEESGLSRRLLALESDRRSLTNYEQVFDTLTERLGDVHGDITLLAELTATFIDDPAILEKRENELFREDESDAVQVMTMHKSKGLEAAVVFLFGSLTRSTSSARIHSYYDGNELCAFWGALPRLGSPIADAVAEAAGAERRRLFYVGATRAKALLVLPFVLLAEDGAGPTGDFRLSGEWQVMNDRLRAIDQSRATDPAVDRLFALVLNPEPFAAPSLALCAAPPASAEAADLEKAIESLCHTRKPAVISSYSSMKAKDQAREAISDESGAAPVHVEIDPLELPGGTNTGLYLHAALEIADLSALADPARADAAALAAAQATRSRFGIDESHVPTAARWIREAFTTPFTPPRGSPIAALAQMTPFRRETPFFFPLPECGDSPFRAAPHLGSMTGVFDFVFEYEGRAYFGDWKSDSLAPAEDVAAAARERYGLQIEVYTAAIVRWLGIRDADAYERLFGGAVYVFLRRLGKTAGGGAFATFRPSWDEVIAADRRIAERFARGSVA